jgi:hypothetical protein
VAGTWFFNPLAWQAIFVLGFTLAKPASGLGAFARRNIVWLRLAGLPIVAAGAIVHIFDLWPDPTRVPNPKLFFIADKTFMTPMRLIQFLALVAVFSFAWPYIRRAAAAPWVSRPVTALIDLLAMLGRNSLYVFCVGSLLSLAAQVVRLYYRGSFAGDTAVVLLGILIMAVTAWLAESRQRGRPAPSSAQRLPAR